MWAPTSKNVFRIRRGLGVKEGQAILSQFKPLYPDKKYCVDQQKGEVPVGWEPILQISPVEGQEMPSTC
eukprot:3775969-Pyramimonas_sp.AAC.1